MTKITSISYDQTEILKNILELYIKEDHFHLDPTFSKGNFYRAIPKPELQFDLFPQHSDVAVSDYCHLPISDNTIRNVIFDPPFVIGKPNISINKKGCNIVCNRFGSFKNKQELLNSYNDALLEFKRILQPGGYLIFKCQDQVSSGKQHLIHCDIYTMALKYSYEPIDIFVLLAKNRMWSSMAKWPRQLHARKYHSYFWVFKK